MLLDLLACLHTVSQLIPVHSRKDRYIKRRAAIFFFSKLWYNVRVFAQFEAFQVILCVHDDAVHAYIVYTIDHTPDNGAKSLFSIVT